MDISGLRKVVASEYARLRDEGLFQWHLGYYCVDVGYVSGRSAGTDPETYVQLTLGRDLWPFESKMAKLDEDWVFTVIEFLFDHAAAPTSSHYHNFSNCGLHVDAADETRGKESFLESMNRYLPRYDSGFELQDTGQIWRQTPSGLQDLEPERTDEPAIDDKVGHAISTFREWSATEQQKRDAINNLADILELMRSGSGSNIPKPEEKRLFEIANNYGIRHLNAKQNLDYDPNIWLDWIFYTFLNAVALATANRARVSGGHGEEHEEDVLPFE